MTGIVPRFGNTDLELPCKLTHVIISWQQEQEKNVFCANFLCGLDLSDLGA